MELGAPSEAEPRIIPDVPAESARHSVFKACGSLFVNLCEDCKGEECGKSSNTRQIILDTGLKLAWWSPLGLWNNFSSK